MEKDIQDLVRKIGELESKINAIYVSSEKMRKYFLWTLIVTLVVVVGPLLLLPLVIPAFLQSVTIPVGF